MSRNDKTSKSAVRYRVFAVPLFLACLLFFSGMAVGSQFSGQRERPLEVKNGEKGDAPRSGTAADYSFQESPWNLRLVNFSHPLPEGFSAALSPVGENGEEFDSRAAGALETMLRAMEDEGLSPVVCSAYRPRETQESLFQNQVRSWLDQGYSLEEAEQEAALLVARPGCSEHELGLAADIVGIDNQILDESQETTPEQQWLLSHCQDYGFILRYPQDKSDITGVSYEPWHYRYVGQPAAREIMSRDICLEEYLESP